MNIVVEVTKDDIKKSARWYGAHVCPVARALRRITGRQWRVLPGLRHIPKAGAIRHPFYAQPAPWDSIKLSLELPKQAETWIRSYDNRRGEARATTPPFQFRLEVPDCFAKPE